MPFTKENPGCDQHACCEQNVVDRGHNWRRKQIQGSIEIDHLNNDADKNHNRTRHCQQHGKRVLMGEDLFQANRETFARRHSEGAQQGTYQNVDMNLFRAQTWYVVDNQTNDSHAGDEREDDEF